MIRLLKIEWEKIAYSKTSRIFIILYFLMLLSLILILTSSFNLSGGAENGLKLNFSKEGAVEFPGVWHFVTFFAGAGKVFLGIIIITLVTNEFSNRTLKQNLIDGLSKQEFLSAKLLIILLFTLISSIVVLGIALGLGLYYTKGDYSIFSEIEFIGYYFLKLITFFSFCLFLSILIKKSAFSFLAIIIWWVLEMILSTAEAMLRFDIFKSEITEVATNAVTNYLPLNCMSNLINWPLLRMTSLQKIFLGKIPYDPTTDWTYAVACIVYAALFILLSYRILKKRDL